MTQKTTASATAKRKFTNEIIEDHGDWLLVDISTPKHPNATMAVDADVFEAHEGGRIHAVLTCESHKYIIASYNHCKKSNRFHIDILYNPLKMEIDHIEHGTMRYIDNRRSNLRIVTRSQNSMNRSVRSDNSSGMSGIHYAKDRSAWCVRIVKNSTRVVVGHFDNVEIAIGVRQQAEREYYGEFAYKGDDK